MKFRLLAAFLGGALALAPALMGEPAAKKKANRSASQSSDMQRAIAYERYKVLAGEREWRKEGNRDATWENRAQADRSADRAMPGTEVKDPGELGKPRTTRKPTQRPKQP